MDSGTTWNDRGLMKYRVKTIPGITIFPDAPYPYVPIYGYNVQVKRWFGWVTVKRFTVMEDMEAYELLHQLSER